MTMSGNPFLHMTYLDLHERTRCMKCKFGQVVIDKETAKGVTASCDAFKEEISNLWHALEHRHNIEASQKYPDKGKVYDIIIMRLEMQHLIRAAERMEIMKIIADYDVVVGNADYAPKSVAKVVAAATKPDVVEEKPTETPSPSPSPATQTNVVAPVVVTNTNTASTATNATNVVAPSPSPAVETNAKNVVTDAASKFP